MNSSARAGLAFLLLVLAAGASDAGAQTPVVTMTASTTSITERLVLSRTTSPTLTTTTTTTTRTGSTTTTAPAANAVTFTVTRTGPTDLTDLTVRYSVGGSALNGKDYTSLSGTVTIPRTQSSATFTVTAIDDIDDEPDETIVVNLTSTATSPYVLNDPARATVTIIDDDDVRLVELDIATDSILAGSSVDVRVTLNGAAPTGGTTIPLSASDGSVTVPTITIAAGTKTGIGQITTTDIASPLSVVVRGSAGGVSGQDTLVLFPVPRVQRVELNRDIVFGGVPVSGTVYLESPAPPIASAVDIRARIVLQTASRTTIGSGTSLTTVSPGALTSPPVTIPPTVPLTPGAPTVAFDIETRDVTMSTNVELTALIGSSSARAPLAIHPVPSIASHTFDPDPVEGGDGTTWTLQLENPIPAGLNWNPSVTSISGYVATNSVFVRFGAGATEWSGTLGTRPVRTSERACLYMGLPGGSRASGGCINISPPAITAFSANRDAYWGGTNVTGSITATRSVGGGYPVSIRIDVLSPAGATSPIANTRVTIPDGSTTTSWSLDSSPVTEATTLQISAPGGVADTITLHPIPSIASHTFDPNPVEGGDGSTWTLQLENPIPSGLNWNPSVSSISGYVATNSVFVRFGAGATEWSGTLGTRPVRSNERACLSMGLPGGTRASGGCIDIRPPAITAFSASRDVYWGGAGVTGSITATRAVGGGYPVRITVDVLSPAGATSPIANTRVTIPSGSTTTSWVLDSSPVPEATTLQISAPGGVADTITLHPIPSIASHTFDPNPVEGGDGATWTLQLEDPIPAGLNWNPSVSSISGYVATNSVFVRFGAGATEWSGTLGTRPVRSNERACMYMGLPGGTRASGGCIDIRPPAITSFSANRDVYWSGTNVTGTITATRAVGGGYPVRLTVDVLSPAGATSPIADLRVVIPSGSASTSWVMESSPVPEATTLQINAPGGIADTITLHPAPSIAATSFDPDPVESGNGVAWTIQLEDPIPTGLSWTPGVRTISNAIAGLSTVSVRFGAGATEWTGTVGTRPVAQRESACIQINLFDGTSASGGCFDLLPPPVTDFTIDRDAGFGGQDVTGSVTVARSTIAGYRNIQLSANVLSPAGAAAPFTVSTVRITPGQSSATWSFPSTAVNQPVTVEITAPDGFSDTITLHPLPMVANVDFEPDSAFGGTPAPLTIRLAQPVPVGLGWDLTLTGLGGLLPTGSRTVQVAGGQAEWSGTVETAPVTARTPATLQVNGGPEYVLILLPRPPAVAAIGVQPRAVTGGSPVSFTVQIDKTAPPGGTPVSLRSSAPAVLQLPPGVTVPAGSDRTTFQANTSVVTSQQIVDFDASANGARVTGQLRVDPQPTPGVTALRTTASNNQIFGGTTIDFIVELDRPAPTGGAVVQFQTSRPDLLDLTGITVPPNATTASVTVRAGVDGARVVTSNRVVLGASQATLAVTVDPQPIDRVQLPGTVQEGTQAQGFVRLSQPAPAGGMLVPLASSNPSAATVPPVIVISAGQTQANFNVNVAAVPVNTEVTIMAGAGVATTTFRIRAR